MQLEVIHMFQLQNVWTAVFADLSLEEDILIFTSHHVQTMFEPKALKLIPLSCSTDQKYFIL